MYVTYVYMYIYIVCSIHDDGLIKKVAKIFSKKKVFVFFLNEYSFI